MCSYLNGFADRSQRPCSPPTTAARKTRHSRRGNRRHCDVRLYREPAAADQGSNSADAAPRRDRAIDRQVTACLWWWCGRSLQGARRSDEEDDPRRARRPRRPDPVRDLLAPGQQARARPVPAGGVPASRGPRVRRARRDQAGRTIQVPSARSRTSPDRVRPLDRRFDLPTPEHAAPDHPTREYSAPKRRRRPIMKAQ